MSRTEIPSREKCKGYTDDDWLETYVISAKRLAMECDEVIKSENDNRSYRTFKLCNGLRVLLISDPTTKVSAAALDVAVGYMNDPIHLQGLAHALQHSLFFLCTKTSAPYKFFDKVKANNGKINAKVSENNTTYYYEIDSDIFPRTLANFNSLFQFPDLNKMRTAKEYRAELDLIEFEFSKANSKSLEKHWNEEITRTIKITIDENHEFTKACGNRQLFEDAQIKNIDILECVRQYFFEHYSSNLMTLCVYGKEHLDKLEQYVNVIFAQMKNLYTPNLAWIAPEFKSVYKIWCSVPEKALSLNYTIRIVFPMCGELVDYKNNALSGFVSYLFEHGGKGSLVSVLRAKHWATSVEAGEIPCPRGFGFFVVAIGLTKKGYLKHFNEVMALFLQYVRILNEISDPELRRLYNEYREIMELKFRYKKNETPFEMVCNLARHMHSVDLNHVLRHKIPKVWSQHCVRHTIRNILQPSLRMRIYLNHPSTCHKNAVLKEYGRIPCRIQLVLPEEYSKWLNGSYSSELNAPVPNKFIPLKTVLKSSKPEEQDVPTIIKDTPLTRIWHNRDNIFHEPRASAYLHFTCPATYESAVNTHLTSLYIDILNVCLEDYKYPADLVDLRWELSTTVRGIMLKINGFDDTLHVLLKKIVEYLIMPKQKIKNFKTVFEVLAYRNLKECEKNIDRFENLPPYVQALRYLPYLLTERLWTPHQVWKNNGRISWKVFNAFLSRLTESIHMECLFHGNITAVEALKMTSIVENIISRSKFNPIPKEKLQLYREVKLKKGDYYKFHRECFRHSSLCELQFYQINERSIKSDILLDLVKIIFQKITRKKFDKLFITCGRHRGNVMQGLTILFLCSADYSCHESVKRNACKTMNDLRTKVNEITDCEFEEMKMAVARKTSETLYKLSDMYWDEILSQRYEFDRRNIEQKCLKGITKETFCRFFQECLSCSIPVLSISIAPKKEDSEKDLFRNGHCCPLELEHKITVINDIKTYLNCQNFYPVPERL